jgi:hypothetical protein
VPALPQLRRAEPVTIASERKLAPKEVAEKYSISTSQLCSWRKNNTGPAYLQPSAKKVIYLLSDVEAYFNRCRIQPGRAGKVGAE